MPVKPGQRHPPASFGIKQYGIRLLLLFSAIAESQAAKGYNEIDWYHGIIILIVGIYAIASFTWIKRSATKPPSENHIEIISMLDAFAIGFVISTQGLFVIPVALFYCMLTLSNLINYGTSKWLKINFYYICGVLLGFFLADKQWGIYGTPTNTIVSILALVAYISSYAFFAHRNIFGLLKFNNQLAREHENYKKNTFKLSQYLTPTVWNAIKSGDESVLQTERKRITVFFSDIQGFSKLSEELEAETLSSLLTTYLTEMSKIALKYRGTIDKFMGDGIMILFGDSDSNGIKGDSIRCVSMALDMRKKMKELQNKWYNQGIKQPLQIRMGINSGYCTVGSFGTAHYRDYTALGTHVNLASRLESASDAGQILVSHETWSLIKDTIMCRDKGEITVKGFSHPIKVYQVIDFRKNLGQRQSYYEESMEGFSIHMDLEKIKNYEKPKVIEYLEDLAIKLKDR